METEAPERSSRTYKVLISLIPLAALSAGVFWYISSNRPPDYSAGVKTEGFNFGAAGPASDAAAARERTSPKPVSALDIQGSPEFKSQVKGALKLIWMADRETFLFIRKNIYIIRNEDRTDFYLDEGRPVAAISNDHAFRSMPWCAGIIAHQAFHAYARSNSSRKKRFLPPPPGTETAMQVEANPMAVDLTELGSVLYAERRACEFQAKVLRLAGGSRAEIKSVESRDERDFFIGHDGNYSVKP